MSLYNKVIDKVGILSLCAGVAHEHTYALYAHRVKCILLLKTCTHTQHMAHSHAGTSSIGTVTVKYLL